MKIYNLKKPLSNREKVKIYIPILIFIIINIILMPFLYYVVSSQTELLRSIITSLVISTLVSIDSVVSQILGYEQKTLVIDKKNISVVMIQKERDFYGTGVKKNIDLDYNNKKVIEDILQNQEKYLGISILKVDNYSIIKKSRDSIKVLLNGKVSKWKYHESRKTAGYILIEKKRKIRMNIDNRYDDAEEIIKYFDMK